ncbi:HNH endonuclease family protein [Solicola sp. PLA-1-18]|uniref:HNH endonuclease family protein n=1 Tax=Solicola sp. PLA-1-18 TaxID=3380532 RepID=UPI003B79875E
MRKLLLALLVAAVVVVTATTPAWADPPTPPSASSARTSLAALTVRAPANESSYDRDEFRHWITQSGTCDTRETVLKRDGDGVAVDSSCQPTRGTWSSVYDGATVADSSDVDIDHMVPLSEAWQSGANAWTDARRETFANDLQHAQLLAVTASSNRSKGDRDPAEWKPTRTAAWCLYARQWVDVKRVYGLSVDSAEKTALGTMLDRC